MQYILSIHTYIPIHVTATTIHLNYTSTATMRLRQAECVAAVCAGHRKIGITEFGKDRGCVDQIFFTPDGR